MTSVLAADYTAAGEMDNSIARPKRDKDSRKKSKRDSRRKVDAAIDPLADFYSEQKRSSPSPPAAATPYSVEIEDGAGDEYSDEERKHRPASPPTPVAAHSAAEKKSRRSTNGARHHSRTNTPPLDNLSSSSSSSAFSSYHSPNKLPPSSSEHASPVPPVSYAPSWSADDSLALRQWLRDNHFDDSVWEALSEYSIADMLAVTKEDLKELLGTKQGIRLYARIQQYKQQQQLASSSPLQPSRRSASSNFSASHSGRYGACAVHGCGHASTNVCNMPSCNAALCMAHQHKSLLTGHVYCASCEADTWEGRVKQGWQSVGERAEETTERIITTTAEWTGTGSLHHSALPSVSRYGHMASSGAFAQPAAAAAQYQYQEEHKQHSPMQSHQGAGSDGGKSRLGIVGDWLQRDDAVSEGGDGGGYYRERSWNDNQCAIQ